MTKRMSQSASSPMPSSRPRASTRTIRRYENWNKHNAALRQRTEWLIGQALQRAALSPAPAPILTIGLRPMAMNVELGWRFDRANNGITCNANIRNRGSLHHAACAAGRWHTSSAPKPLSYQGTLIDNIQVKFEEGRIVEAKASRGEEVLNKVLDTDEGARRLGEVALVPHSSPISASGLLFFNTLFDENAACHIALGQCYSKCFVDGAKLTQDQIAAQGGNKSLIHIDWMIGSDKIDIDGLYADSRPPRAGVFRKGEWA